jgi:hypothetical protein
MDKSCRNCKYGDYTNICIKCINESGKSSYSLWKNVECENDIDKALYLPILDLSEYGNYAQYKKVIEEWKEFYECDVNTPQELEEGIDNILAMWNYLNKQYNKEQIREAFKYNMQKAKNRYKVIGRLMISEVE